MDPLQKAEQEQNFIEKITAWVPGYQGYKQKELRREADQELRKSLVTKVSSRERRLTAIQNQLVEGGNLNWVDDVEKLVAKTQHFSDRVRTASYGYSPFFDIEKVTEDDLDRLYRFDTRLGDNLVELDEALAGLEGAVEANAKIKEAVAATNKVLNSFNDTFNRRQEVIRGMAES